MSRPKWYYRGDINPEYGGVWYRLDNVQYGFADCVRITPCSDAGLPNNQFWVEILTVSLPDDDKMLRTVLDVCGRTVNDLPEDDSRWPQIIDACMEYGEYYTNHQVIIQIGSKVCAYYHGREPPLPPDVTLRSDAHIENYVKRTFLKDR